jgi:hypothetical protein
MIRWRLTVSQFVNTFNGAALVWNIVRGNTATWIIVAVCVVLSLGCNIMGDRARTRAEARAREANR